MKNILILGAGRSAGALIDYVLEKAPANQWFITVADANPEMAKAKVGTSAHGRGIWLDVNKPNDRREILSKADIVVSLLPPSLHILVAQDCIKLKKHLLTASYVNTEMQLLNEAAKAASLTFMCELGLDPGIDHLSTMQKIHQIKAQGGKITSYRSFTGGLVAPESDDNPWHYKFSWNPRNVVLAGQGTAQYLERGQIRYIPYPRLFASHQQVNIPSMGNYEGYPNRNSLSYISTYELDGIPNIMRGTLRHRGYCDAWQALVTLGLTEGAYPIHDSHNLTYHDWIDGYIPNGQGSLKERLANFLHIEQQADIMEKLEWLGIFRKKKIGIKQATPADILEKLLLEKWQLQPSDKDMVIMKHEFEYELNGKKHLLTSTMVMKGEDGTHTAMSKLVGLPLAIFVRLLANGEVQEYGVNIPVMKNVYEPLLKELATFGVVFHEEEKILN